MHFIILLPLLIGHWWLAPAHAQTPAPFTAYPTYPVTPQPSYASGSFPVCYLCGDPGQRVTNMYLILRFPDGFVYTCLQAEMIGLNGQLSSAYCSLLPEFNLAEACGCANTLAPSAPTEAPIAPPTYAPHTPVTLKPTHKPTTSVPTVKPTLKPSPPPTKAPTLKPTVAPVVVPTSRPIPPPTTAPVVIVPTSRPIPPTAAPMVAPATTTQSPTVLFGRMKTPPQSKNALKFGNGGGAAGGHSP